MKGCTRALCSALAVIAALSMSSMSTEAWAQAAGQPPGTPGRAASPLGEREFDARVGALLQALPPIQLGTAWERVVDAALQQLEALPQAATPAVASETAGEASSDALTVPALGVGIDEEGVAEEAAEAGPTLRWKGLRFTPTPVFVDSPVVTNVRAPNAVLLGVTMRLPWLVP